MLLIKNFAIFINILLVLVFIAVEKIRLNGNILPKKKAIGGVAVVFVFAVYLILLALIMSVGLYKHSLSYLVFLFFIVAPFIIGKLVKYKNLMFYFALQMLLFIVSCGVLFLI